MPLPEMLEKSAIAAVLSNPRLPDNPIVECNRAFEELTGYSASEILGRNCRFLNGPETEPWLTETLRTGIRRRQPVMVEITNYRKDGTRFRNAVMVAPIFDDDGELMYYLGSQVEIPGEQARENDMRRQVAHEKIQALSARQRAVLVQMAAGKLNKQIAWELGLSERTVKMHRGAVLKALGVRTTAEAIRVAIEAGY
ncbi:PAS domain-containing protein [Novosphingobium flavum]|uniref:PAS domain-containing protein n=1 Tax=Novosphingobium aerophilum TaxID=2839843 RepID=A0A7X1KBL7_9SPHN|nr:MULTISPECIES: PAS domain-containing protein [Novosphingobium]MBC2651364.1 PAS domain-containing protein [Novosphingobium aerophilum]MBC2661184.1 PAS domain-containing protein [Novosphingobium aerophilum]